MIEIIFWLVVWSVLGVYVFSSKIESGKLTADVLAHWPRLYVHLHAWFHGPIVGLSHIYAIFYTEFFDDRH